MPLEVVVGAEVAIGQPEIVGLDQRQDIAGYRMRSLV